MEAFFVVTSLGQEFLVEFPALKRLGPEEDETC